MAILSTHTLDGTNGTHAPGIGVSLSRVYRDGAREVIFSSSTDDGGRLVQSVAADRIDAEATHELVFDTGRYWTGRFQATHGDARAPETLVTEIVVRLMLPCPEARYHVPIILSPNAYSLWCSERPEPGK